MYNTTSYLLMTEFFFPSGLLHPALPLIMQIMQNLSNCTHVYCCGHFETLCMFLKMSPLLFPGKSLLLDNHHSCLHVISFGSGKPTSQAYMNTQCVFCPTQLYCSPSPPSHHTHWTSALVQEDVCSAHFNMNIILLYLASIHFPVINYLQPAVFIHEHHEEKSSLKLKCHYQENRSRLVAACTLYYN